MWKEEVVTPSDIPPGILLYIQTETKENSVRAGVGMTVDTTLLDTKKQRFRHEIRQVSGSWLGM